VSDSEEEHAPEGGGSGRDGGGLGGADGGYVMLSSFKENGIAYSFGISNDVTWDNIMAELGYNIWQYDHTINALPYERKEFHWFKEGISGEDLSDKPLKSLNDKVEGIMSQNGKIIDAAGKIADYCNDIIGGYMNDIVKKLEKFEVNIKKAYKKVD
jgi:hypothetical protein